MYQIIFYSLVVFLLVAIVIRITEKLTKKRMQEVHKKQMQVLKEQMQIEFKNSIIEVSDTFKPSEKRTEEQIRQDAVMKLKNEIAESRAMITEKNDDGTYTVKLKIVKQL